MDVTMEFENVRDNHATDALHKMNKILNRESCLASLTNRQEYEKRLLTFQASTYYAKPPCLSPLFCARFGWVVFLIIHSNLNTTKHEFYNIFRKENLRLPASLSGVEYPHNASVFFSFITTKNNGQNSPTERFHQPQVILRMAMCLHR